MREDLPVPDASVVVPTHNRRRLALLTVRSLLSQVGVDLEVIVVDDGSVDGTADAVRNLADERIKIVRNDVAQGVSAARDRGRSEARGDWVGFCDDDDLWAPTKLQSQILAADALGRDWAYVGVINVDDDLQVVSGRPPRPPEDVVRALPHYNAIPGGGSNVIVRAELLKRMPPFDRRLKNTEDWEMWIRLAAEGPPACDARPLMAYRIHSGNASLDAKAILAGVRLIEQTHHTSADMGMIHRWLGESSLRTGDRRAGLKHLVLATMNGESRAVAGDIRAILRRKIARFIRSSPGGNVQPDYADWRSQANGWLAELRSWER
jgi:hypothetical protein